MATITRDVTLQHRSQKDAEPVEVALATGDEVHVIKEWETHFLIRTANGKVLNVAKEFVDPGA